MNYLKITTGIFLALAASRFIPHPPNFTSLIALGFYVPALLGLKFIPALIVSFIITDLIIGFHGTVLFTWGAVIFIGLLSQFFSSSILIRLTGSLLGAILFFIITNFGVWSAGFYGYTFSGLISCYLLAIPFFAYTFISTLSYSILIETIYYFIKVKLRIIR
jgi:hypothetical protein